MFLISALDRCCETKPSKATRANAMKLEFKLNFEGYLPYIPCKQCFGVPHNSHWSVSSQQLDSYMWQPPTRILFCVSISPFNSSQLCISNVRDWLMIDTLFCSRHEQSKCQVLPNLLGKVWPPTCAVIWLLVNKTTLCIFPHGNISGPLNHKAPYSRAS